MLLVATGGNLSGRKAVQDAIVDITAQAGDEREFNISRPTVGEMAATGATLAVLASGGMVGLLAVEFSSMRGGKAPTVPDPD